MNAIVTACLWCALQVTIFAALVGCLYLLVRRWNPAAGKLLVAGSSVLVILLSAMAFSPWPRWEWGAIEIPLPDRSAVPVTSPPTSAEVSPATAATGVAEGSADASETATISHWFGAFRQELENDLNPKVDSASQSAWQWKDIVVLTCLAISALGLLRLAAGFYAVRLYRKRGQPITDRELLEVVDVLRAELSCRRPVELLEVARLGAPATVGWLRPVVLLPVGWQSWTVQECRAVLAHEISHICRGDFLMYAVAQVGLMLHFYNPLVHWLAGRLRLEQELAADASAAAFAGGRLEYLQLLAAMALRQADPPLSWPARTFLPTRGHLIRRVEMLKHSKRLSTGLSTAPRAVVVALLAVVGIGIVGLRAPDVQVVSADERQQSRSSDAKPAVGDTIDDRFELSYVPSNAVAVLGVRPAAVFRNEESAATAEMLNENLGIQEMIGVPVEQIEQISVAVTDSEEHPIGGILRSTFGTVMIRTVRPTDFQHLTDFFAPGAEEKHHDGRAYFKSAKLGSCYMRLDDRTLLLDDEASLKNVIENGPENQSELLTGAAWDVAAESHLFCALDPNLLSKALTPTLQPAIVSAFAPVWKDSKTLMICGTLDQDVSVQGFANCVREEDAQRIQSTLQGAPAILTNVLRESFSADDPFAAFAGEALAYLKGSKVTRNEKFVHVTSTSPITLNLLMATVMMPGMSAQQFVWRRNKAIRNSRQIALAMHKYHDVHGHLPPAVVIGPDGKTPHSWRVALLPYLDLQAAGDQYLGYKLDEPWDSEHNKRLLRKMPAVYGHDDGAGVTRFVVFVGPETPFGNPDGTALKDIGDGIANTLMTVESNQMIPWTKPEDIPYDPAAPFSKLVGNHPHGIVVAKVDGAIALMPSEGISDELWRSVITYDGTRRDAEDGKRATEFFKMKLPLTK